MQEWDHWRIKLSKAGKDIFGQLAHILFLGLCFEYLRVMFGCVLVLASVQVHRWQKH
jgi:hypothetical protein